MDLWQPGRSSARTGFAVMTVVLLGCAVTRAGAQPAPRTPPVDSNVVFGRYSGLALLMDVHRPLSPNGYGIVYVPGSGFHTPLGYDAPPITIHTRPLVPALVGAGYTVFVVNHRAAPTFRHPAALEDVQRAVRFVRSRAADYGIQADRLGAAGYSSGGTLASLLGVTSGDPAPDGDPVSRMTARVQCVVAGGAAFDFVTLKSEVALPILGSYLGAVLTLGYAKDGPEYRLYQSASPLHHVSRGDAPHFIFHGDADTVLPIQQAESMVAALRGAGVPVTFLRLPGGGHGAFTVPGGPDVLKEMTGWLSECLRRP